MEDKTLELAQDILENIIAVEFPFYLKQKEMDESGNFTDMYTEKADRILDKLINKIKNYNEQ